MGSACHVVHPARVALTRSGHFSDTFESSGRVRRTTGAASRSVSDISSNQAPKEGTDMWDTVQTNREHLSHDMPCARCGHAAHTYLPCDADCGCETAMAPVRSLVAAGRS
jgi:hypothetical protein